VLFKQFVDDDLGCASYVVGDEAAGEAVVVDPAYDIQQYIDEAARHEVRITAVLETHNHADHVSGHGRFALEHGTPVRIHPAAEPEYPADFFADGEEIGVGGVVLRVMHTPGHRPEHCCFAVSDRSRAPEPWLVLTGDSLLVGDTARPDLADEARSGAGVLYRSLRRLLQLDDGVEVYPGHVAGSLCGAAMSSKASTTIGFERRFNHGLLFSNVNSFIDASASIGSPRPPNMERIVALNRGPFLGKPPPLEPVSDTGGAMILDVRRAADFAAGHIPGAINVPVSASSFATRAAFVLLPEERVVIYASSPDEAGRAARSLHAVGFLELGGYLEHAETPEQLQPIGLDELERLVAQEAIQVVDVRDQDERDDGYIPGSRNIPYRLVRRCAEELRGGPPVATICESGARASIAASVLAAAGIDARPVMYGGIPEWQRRGNAMVTFRRCGS
jgi:hydroxyacylglutathione hydrolase